MDRILFLFIVNLRLRAFPFICLVYYLKVYLYFSANNEPHDRDSLNETGSTTGGTTEGNPGISRDKAGPSEPADTNQSAKPTSTTAPSRSLVSRILARARSPDDLLDQPEP